MPSISIKRKFLLFVLIIEFLMVLPSAGVTYYVKPSQSSSQCPGQPCETLQYYLDNTNTTLNQEKNITMDFLMGKHNVSFNGYTITTPIIMMIGNGEESDVQLIVRLPFYGLFGFF